MTIDTLVFTGGFREPVFQSQSAFRTLMDCMARPGTVGRIAPAVLPPPPLGAMAGAVALTLCDQDTPVWLTPGLAGSALPAWLAFHAGAPVTDDRQTARFAFIEKAALLPSLSLFAQGTQDYPDRSTTIVVEIEAVEGGRPFRLTGPGIRDEAIVAPRGLPDLFAQMWSENRRAFPCGVDLVLATGEEIACLPRTTVVRPLEA